MQKAMQNGGLTVITVQKPLGFANPTTLSEFLDIPLARVLDQANSGDWPTYEVAGRRLFDVDEILRLIGRSTTTPTDQAGAGQ